MSVHPRIQKTTGSWVRAENHIMRSFRKGFNNKRVKIVMRHYEVFNMGERGKDGYERERSLFYRHYGSMEEFFQNNEFWTVIGLRRTIERIPKLASSEDFFTYILLFIQDRKEFFEIFHAAYSNELWVRLLNLAGIRKHVTKNWNFSPRVQDRMFRLWCYEAIGILTLWGDDHFHREDVPAYARRLAFATRVASTTLMQAAN